MNNIVGVRSGIYSAERESDKYLKVIVPCGDGEMLLSCAEETHRLCKGQIAVVPAFAKHTASGGTEKTVTVFIEQPLLPLKSVKIISDVVNCGVRLAAEQALAFSAEADSTLIMNALGALIVSYIGAQSKRTDSSPVVAMLREDIERGATDYAYSVETAIRKLPLSYDYVRKLFKKETGLTPHEYLTAVRMERAGKIILSGVSNRYSAYSIGQIAEACGYAEPLYFSRVFKKYYGVSPTDYAKRSRK